MRMYYGITDDLEEDPCVFLGGKEPGLLVLDKQGEPALPIFGSFHAFMDFSEALYPEGENRFAAYPLGPTLFEVAEAVLPAVETGEIKRVVFDPVVGFMGQWSDTALDWPARIFCDFLGTVRPKVIEMAGGGTSPSDDKQPHPEEMRQALRRCMKRLWAYLDED
jgi:hypothetical protein